MTIIGNNTKLYCPHCGQDMTNVMGNACIACKMPITAEIETARYHESELEEMTFLVNLKDGIESRNDELLLEKLLLEKWASMSPAEFLEPLIKMKRHGRSKHYE